MAGQLFDDNGKGTKKSKDTSIASGIAGAKLKSKEDHINFAITVAAKLSESTSFNVAAFLKELSERTKASLSVESLTDIIDSLTALRELKKKTEDPQKGKTVKKSKKAIKIEEKMHNDKFGFVEDNSAYGSYSNLEDDFM